MSMRAAQAVAAGRLRPLGLSVWRSHHNRQLRHAGFAFFDHLALTNITHALAQGLPLGGDVDVLPTFAHARVPLFR